MSKNIINAVNKYSSINPIFGLIPTRRQIDYNGGYVSPELNSEELKYITESSVPVLRDHGGPNQGTVTDDGFYSLAVDARYFDGIHIDPFVKFPTVTEGLEYTAKAIELIHSIDDRVFIEILTEQAIRYFSVDQMRFFLEELQYRLTPEQFEMIKYCVIQSGVRIDLVDQVNTGTFSSNRLAQMVSLCKEFNLLSKEHNGDYLDFNSIKFRFDNGLDSLNIGPEIAQIETKAVLEELTSSDIDKWYNNCVKSNKWKRWQTNNFNLDNKEQVIMVCGHYNRVNTELPNFDSKVEKRLFEKFNQLYEASK